MFASRLLCCLGLAAGATTAQALDEVLVVEQREDIAARDRARPLLTAATLSLRAPLTVTDACTLLATACGGRLVFVFQGKSKKAADLAALEVDLQRVTPLQVLALLRDHLDVIAVWRAGLVCLMPKVDVKEATWLQFYDVRAAVMPLRDFPGPELTLRTPGEEPRSEAPDAESSSTVSGFTAEQLVELVRNHAGPDTFAGDEVAIVAQGGILAVRQTERGHREVRQVLAALGVVATAPRARTVRASPAGGTGTKRTPAAAGPEQGKPAARSTRR